MDTKVSLLDSGTIVMEQADLFWLAGRKGSYRAPVFGVLIEHRDGRFLFDTGQNKAIFDRLIAQRDAAAGQADQPADEGGMMVIQSEAQQLPAQLALAGLKPTDINFVMNSHYHVDHCGGNRACTCAQMIVHRREYEAALNPHPIEVAGYCDIAFLSEELPADEAAGLGAYKPNLHFVSGDIEVAKGVRLFETPGHTPGHYSLLVELAGRRPMLFTGDACYAKTSMDLMAVATAHVDPKQAYDSLGRLKALAQEHDAELFYAHDQEAWPNYRKAPYFYA